jgi:ElaB/YqjD/DUF883 family membrane-anchored ribosome-binding protein
MLNSFLTQLPLPRLLRGLTHDVKLFFQEEVELAKREMAEKVSCYTRNAITLAVGGFVAYAGLIVLLGGLGFLAAFGFQKLGLEPLLADCLGLGAVGLVIVLIGLILLLKGMAAISTGSLAPERTIHALKHFKGDDGDTYVGSQQKHDAPKPSPEELEKEVLETENRIGETIEAIAYRTSPARIKEKAAEHIQTHPYTWSAVALGSGLVGSLLLTRKGRRY